MECLGRSVVCLVLLLAGCSGGTVSDPDAGVDALTDAGDQDADAGPDAGDRTDGGDPTGDGDGGADGAGGDDGGHEAPGCADPQDPTLTDSERLLLDLPADSWYVAPDTKLIDVCGPVTSHGDGIYLVSGCRAIVSAWGGGAYDSLRQRMVVWGGGHNDYGGNELYAFDLKTMTWLQLTDPSQPPFSRDPLDDGNPVSRHTYDGVEFLTHRGTLMGWGGSRSTDGSGTDLTWEFDFDAGSWTRRAADPPAYASPFDFGLAYDPISLRVFMHSHARLGAYDPDADAWTDLENFGYPPWTGVFDLWVTRTGAVDPERRLFVTVGEGAPMLVWDIDAGQVLSLDGPWSAVTGGEQVLGRPAPGLDYDVAARSLVAWSGGAPHALDADAKQWVPLSAAGAPVEQVGTGTYGRWRYAERYNVFVLVNGADQDVLFYKHTPGCGR